MKFILLEQSELVQQHVDTLHNVFPLNVSRLCFLMGFQGMHNKFCLGTGLAGNIKKMLNYSVNTSLTIWATAVNSGAYKYRYFYFRIAYLCGADHVGYLYSWGTIPWG